MDKNLSTINRVKSIKELEAEVDSRFYRMLSRRDIFGKLSQVYRDKARQSDKELLHQCGYRPGNRELSLREAFWDEVRECSSHGVEDVDIAKICNSDLMVVKLFRELLQTDNFCQFLLNRPVSYMQVMKVEVLSKANSIYQEILDKPMDGLETVKEWYLIANMKLKVLSNIEKVCGVGAAQKIALRGSIDVNSNNTFDNNSINSGAASDTVSRMSIEQIKGRIEELEKGIKSRQRVSSDSIEAEFTDMSNKKMA